MTQTLSRYVRTERVMGTVVSFDVRGADPATEAVDRSVRWLRDVDARFSTYRPDSEVCRYDRGELLLCEASPNLRLIADRCERLRQATGGFFDAYATGPFDPSALVKGWAVQRAADDLRAAGVDGFCINGGGDVVTHGRPAPDGKWRVGIRHPHDAQALAYVVEAEGDLSVATSGLYERAGHIVDPASGAAPQGVLSVTVVGRDLGVADAYATAAFAMGTDGPAWTLGLDGYEAMTILADGVVLTTPAFP
jgi:thiamine biosynthesis lipoprotein